MTNLRGLALFTLFLPGTASRRFRIEDSHHEAQQSNTSTNAFDGSAEAREVFNPLRLVGERNTPGSLHTGHGPRSQRLLKSKRPARPLMQGKSRENPWTEVQGESLRTWSFQSPGVEQVQVDLTTAGGPLEAVLELWSGPDNNPVSMRVYGEDGQLRPLSTVIGTPYGPNTVMVRNIGMITWPMAAMVGSNNVYTPSPEAHKNLITVQGNSLRHFPFEPRVDSVEVLLSTDGRPLNARLELLQGPNSVKQVIELYTEDGLDRPCFFILETPGTGNVVRIVNTGPVAFPLIASVVAHSMSVPSPSDDVIIGGGDRFQMGDARSSSLLSTSTSSPSSSASSS